MKLSKGFTLVELLIAIAITAIMLPLLGVVFYQLMVTPPEQVARLDLNNQLELISSYLNNDAHMADNFTLGTYPYYGNFSWTNYSTGACHLISYYYTGDCSICAANNSSCLNTCGHIARTESITYNCSSCPCK